MDRGSGTAGPTIRGFAPGGFRIDDGVYRAALLTATGVIEWAPPPLDALDEAALDAVLGEPVEFVLLGTGSTLAHPPRALVAALEARGTGLEAMDSRAAARAWGLLRSEGRTIAAALYPL